MPGCLRFLPRIQADFSLICKLRTPGYTSKEPLAEQFACRMLPGIKVRFGGKVPKLTKKLLQLQDRQT